MQSWQSTLGIKLEVFVEVLTDSELNTRVQQKNYQVAFMPLSFSDNTAFHALHMFTSEENENLLSFKDKNYDSLVSDIKDASTLKDTQKRTLKAEKYLLDSAAIVSLYENKVYFGHAKGVSGTFFNLTGDIAYFKHTLSE
jgi:ABC-type oligopeptide transport system substrate-binding subunit